MTDLRTLTDAFDELERRGDAAAARMSNEVPLRRQSRPMTRLVPVAVAVAVIGGLATGVAVFAPGGDAGTPVGAAPTSATPTAPPTPVSTTPTTPTSPVPATPEELADRFRTVLGDTATFTVTDTGHPMSVGVPESMPQTPGNAPAPDGSGGPADPLQPEGTGTPNGAAIVGLLTASGVTGGYDLQIYQSEPRTEAFCDNPDQANCTINQLPDGALLAIGQTALEGSPNGVTYQVNLVRADGVTLLMHVSNERDPKGASEVLAPQPPLTVDRMVAILKSDGW